MAFGLTTYDDFIYDDNNFVVPLKCRNLFQAIKRHLSGGTLCIQPSSTALLYCFTFEKNGKVVEEEISELLLESLDGNWDQLGEAIAKHLKYKWSRQTKVDPAWVMRKLLNKS